MEEEGVVVVPVEATPPDRNVTTVERLDTSLAPVGHLEEVLLDKAPTVAIVPAPVGEIKEKDSPVSMMRVFAILLALENHVNESCQVGKR